MTRERLTEPTAVEQITSEGIKEFALKSILSALPYILVFAGWAWQSSDKLALHDEKLQQLTTSVREIKEEMKEVRRDFTTFQIQMASKTKTP